MTFSIRKADRDDLDCLCLLMTELAGHQISTSDMLDRLEFIEKSEIDDLFVCEESGTVLGLLGFRIRVNLEEVSRFGEISAIVVHPEHRQKGIGHFMMDYADKRARGLGCKGMWLVSGFGREEEAHKFYKALGYQTTGYRFAKPF